jgi:hypothetical protein
VRQDWLDLASQAREHAAMARIRGDKRQEKHETILATVTKHIKRGEKK